MGQRAAGVEAGRDERQCGAERECLGRRVASHPAAIGERLEDRVRGALGQIQFAHDVGESNLAPTRPAEQLDDVENSFGRRRTGSAHP